MLVPLLLFIYSCWIGLFWFCHYLGCLVGFGPIFRVVVGLLVFRLLFYIGWVFAGVQKVRVFCKIWKRVIQALVNFGDSSEYLFWYRFSTTVIKQVFVERDNRWSSQSMTVLLSDHFKFRGSFSLSVNVAIIGNLSSNLCITISITMCSMSSICDDVSTVGHYYAIMNNFTWQYMISYYGSRTPQM